jgi:hypothetical protein
LLALLTPLFFNKKSRPFAEQNPRGRISSIERRCGPAAPIFAGSGRDGNGKTSAFVQDTVRAMSLAAIAAFQGIQR